MRTTRSFVSRAVLPVVAMTMCLGLSACGDDQASADRSPITPTGDATAEPADEPTETESLSPEEEVKEELEAMLHDTVAALDDFYQNAEEWHARASGEVGDAESYEEATAELSYDQMRVTGEALNDFSDSRIVWLNNAWMTDGAMAVTGLEFSSIDLDSKIPTASATACIDQSEMEILTFDGDPAPDAPEPTGQTWEITWQETKPGDPRVDPSEERAEWYITKADITPETPC